jgi:predicted NBD/HSP70 family sugar kinase
MLLKLSWEYMISSGLLFLVDRPFSRARYATLKRMLVTVDTGGTKTLVASFSEEGVLGEERRFPTPKDSAEYIKVLRRVLIEMYGTKPVEAIVVAIPGTIKDGIAVWCENLKWKNFDVAHGLKDVLGDVPILVENDANLAGLAEARELAPIPRSVLYVTVSTGIGTGIITEGHIDPGLRYSEGGRMPIEFQGKMTEWEQFASGQAIYKKYGLYARDIHKKSTWNEIADRISRGLLATIPIIQPDTIVIGGSIGTYFDKYATQLKDILYEKLPPHIPTPIVVEASHPEEAVIYGCYYYALDTLTPTEA